MEKLYLILIVLLAGALFIAISRNKNSHSEKESSILLQYIDRLKEDTSSRLDKIDERIHQSLLSSNQQTEKHFDHNVKMIKEITLELEKVKETNKQVLSFSEKLQSLEHILKNPKQRGILGEYFLESLLANVFQPGQYKMQYTFENGEKVDAVVFINEKIIPIDAKFSLEKYNLIIEEQDSARSKKLEKEFINDIKNRIDETSKYIRPTENTTDFAFMFIPAEGVYYSLLAYKVGELKNVAVDLIEYAFKKKVIIVSPTSFFAYLETVLQGLKALEIEKSVKEILQRIGELGTHMQRYEEHFVKLGTHLSRTVSSYNQTQSEFKKLDKDILKLSGTGIIKEDNNYLDKPNAHE